MIQNKIKSLGSVLSGWLQRRPASTIGIDIGTGTLKVVEISWTANGPEIKAVGLAELPQAIMGDGNVLNKDGLTDFLRRTLSASGITGDHAAVAVNGQSVLVRELTFPKMTSDEIRQAIKWDIDKYVPAADVDKYYFDFAIAEEKAESNEVKVLLVAAPLELISNLVSVLKAVGLKPVAIDIEPLAYYRTMNNVANSMVIDIGAKVCQLNIFQDGCPAVSRSIPLGGRRYTEVIMRTLELEEYEAERLKVRQQGLLAAEDSQGETSEVHGQLMLLVEELAREISRTADYYQIQNRNVVVDNIIITGGGAMLTNLARQLSSKLGRTQVLVHNPLKDIRVSPSIDPTWLDSIGPQLSIAMGLALRGGETD